VPVTTQVSRSIEVTRPARGFVDGDGIRLSYGYWPGRGAPILAIHGQTASHMNFGGIADRLGGRRPVFAPDMRGRGDSDKPGDGYTFEQYARDIAAAVRSFGLGPSVVVGHSMGAWIGAALAADHPELVSGLVFIDGGYPVPAPEGVTYEQLFDMLLGPSLARLDRTWTSFEEYLEYWRGVGTVRPEDWTPWWEAYLRNDLAGEPPEMRCKPLFAAVKADWFNMADAEAAGERIRRLEAPIRIITAEHGVVWGAPPIQHDENVEIVKGLGRVESATRVAGTTHYTIGFADPGITACAEAIAEFADGIESGAIA
jgi:pimeloyl-ACP methyl ester carboxylesterase